MNKTIELKEGIDWWVVGTEPTKSRMIFYINLVLLNIILFLTTIFIINY